MKKPPSVDRKLHGHCCWLGSWDWWLGGGCGLWLCGRCGSPANNLRLMWVLPRQLSGCSCASSELSCAKLLQVELLSFLEKNHRLKYDILTSLGHSIDFHVNCSLIKSYAQQLRDVSSKYFSIQDDQIQNTKTNKLVVIWFCKCFPQVLKIAL